MTESLIVAREKLARVVEIYAPGHPNVRPAALEAWSAALLEFEAAVREDERADSAAKIVKAQAEVLEAQARAVGVPEGLRGKTGGVLMVDDDAVGVSPKDKRGK